MSSWTNPRLRRAQLLLLSALDISDMQLVTVFTVITVEAREAKVKIMEAGQSEVLLFPLIASCKSATNWDRYENAHASQPGYRM